MRNYNPLTSQTLQVLQYFHKHFEYAQIISLNYDILVFTVRENKVVYANLHVVGPSERHWLGFQFTCIHITAPYW